jgi:hypothetical protein
MPALSQIPPKIGSNIGQMRAGRSDEQKFRNGRDA